MKMKNRFLLLLILLLPVTANSAPQLFDVSGYVKDFDALVSEIEFQKIPSLDEAQRERVFKKIGAFNDKWWRPLTDAAKKGDLIAQYLLSGGIRIQLIIVGKMDDQYRKQMSQLFDQNKLFNLMDDTAAPPSWPLAHATWAVNRLLQYPSEVMAGAKDCRSHLDKNTKLAAERGFIHAQQRMFYESLMMMEVATKIGNQPCVKQMREEGFSWLIVMWTQPHLFVCLELRCNIEPMNLFLLRPQMMSRYEPELLLNRPDRLVNEVLDWTKINWDEKSVASLRKNYGYAIEQLSRVKDFDAVKLRAQEIRTAIEKNKREILREDARLRIFLD